MKKITSKTEFEFNAGSGEVLAIGPDGALASNEAAALVSKRFGGIVTIEDADPAEEAQKLVDGAGDTISESMKRDELEAEATKVGLTADEIKDAKTKKALVEAILAKSPAKVEEPVAPAADATAPAA